MGGCDMMAYLMMMSPRLVELKRVLKPTGSLYLHCDPTASHYLKLLLDAIFGGQNFRNEITWKRSHAHSDSKQGRKGFGNVADIILYYSKSEAYLFNTQYLEYSQEYIDKYYRYRDADGRRYWLDNLTGPGGAAKGNPSYEVMGVTRHWRYSKERMQKLISEGRVIQTKPGNVPQYKRYLDEMPGVPLQNIWTDISPINMMAKERLGYPTQKPVALLERIINASSNPGDFVLDPFCGCGTTIDAAEKSGREWIGIDITQIAMTTIKKRLWDTYHEIKTVRFTRGSDAPEGREGRAGSPLPAAARGEASKLSDGAHGVTRPTEMVVRIIGEPATPEDAAAMAKDDPYGFQWWAAGLVGGQGAEEKKKGADGGIDGRIIFFDDPKSATGEEIILQVKGGNLKADDVRALGFVVQREQAAMGVLISVAEPTNKMYADAAAAGYYTHKLTGQKYPKLQLRTVKELMEGKGIERPSEHAARDETFKKAPTSKRKSAEDQILPGM